MSQKLISKMLSVKVGYSDKATKRTAQINRVAAPAREIRIGIACGSLTGLAFQLRRSIGIGSRYANSQN